MHEPFALVTKPKGSLRVLLLTDIIQIWYRQSPSIFPKYRFQTEKNNYNQPKFQTRSRKIFYIIKTDRHVQGQDKTEL